MTLTELRTINSTLALGLTTFPSEEALRADITEQDLDLLSLLILSAAAVPPPPPDGGGDVVGPAAATDNAIVRFDSTTGKLLQNSTATLSDGGAGAFTALSATTPLPVTSGGTGLAVVGTALQVLRTNAGATAAEWGTVAGSGDVVGPASSTDNAIARFDMTTGKLLQTSTVTVDDTGSISVGGTLVFHTSTSNLGTFAGRGAGALLLSTDTKNTAFGYHAMGSATGGGADNANSAFGYVALDILTTGDSNTAIGDGALKTVTTGNGNTAVGAHSMLLCTGDHNTAVGNLSADSLTTGTYNVSIGYNAATALTIGANNVVIGKASAGGLTTGSDNITIGDRAGNSIGAGASNIALGLISLFSTTGSNNIGIGQSAGQNATGSGGIFIGFEAGKNETGAAKLYIDNSATATPLIGGDFAANTLTFNGAVTITGASTLTGGIVGRIDASNATAGHVGEQISASVVQGSALALTTATPLTVTSISLTAGDWDVTAIGCLTGASTGTVFDVAIGTTTNSLTGTVLGDSHAQTPTVSLTGADATLMIPQFRVNISSTTTYYLIVQETFTVGSPAAYGRLSARRRR